MVTLRSLTLKLVKMARKLKKFVVGGAYQIELRNDPRG